MNSVHFLLLVALAISGASARDLQGLHVTAGGTCTAEASSETKKIAYDGLAEAIVKARIKGCSDDYNGDKLVREYCKIHDAYALALVKVWVSASAKCETYGPGTVGCASALAQAQGYKSAVISVIAKAYARAVNICPEGCDPKAAAKLFAELCAEVFARAEAKVRAAVCVVGNAYASAEAFTYCHAKSLAHGMAQAHALAQIHGKCVRVKNGLFAEAEAQAHVAIDADPECYCKGWVKVCTGPKQSDCTFKKQEYKDQVRGSVRTTCPLTYAYFKGECEAGAALLG